MSVKLETFDTSAVSALTDARLYEFLTNKQAGIVDGVEITSTGGLCLQITSGWGVILGRVFTIKSEDIVVNPSLSGGQKGRLILQIDISNQSEPIKFVTQAAQSLPKLQQEDINKNGTVYQLELATYNVSEVSLSELVVSHIRLQSSNNSWSLSGGTPLSPTTDLNTVTKIGNYYSENWGVTLPNAPVRSAFTMKVYSGTGISNSTIIQEVLSYDIQNQGIEHKRKGTYDKGSKNWSFGEWIATANTKDVNAVKTVANNAMPKSGGEFTGQINTTTSPASEWTIKNCAIYQSSGGVVSENNRVIKFYRK